MPPSPSAAQAGKTSRITRLSASLSRYGVGYIAAWTAFMVSLTLTTLYFHHQDTLKEAESEARNYFLLNQFYRGWAARLGGVYAPADKVAPNPYLTTPRRDLRTEDGQELTLVNPAYMTRMVFEAIRHSSATPVISKLVSDRPLNPANAPDPWEREAIEAFIRKGATERTQLSSINGQPYLRYISRFTTLPPCLTCHGVQGYRTGEVRGGITIAIPLAPYLASEAQTRNDLVAGYLALWFAGTVGIGASSRKRTRYEERLRASEEKFRTICDWTQDWEYWIDASGELRYLSPSCEEHTGHPPDAFLADPDLLARLVHPEDREAYVHHVRQSRLQPKECAGTHEFRIIARDGTLRWIHHACRPVFSAGNYQGRRISNRDITVQKLHEQELAVRAELLNCVSDSVLVLDRGGKILDANETAWRWYGSSREELLELNLADFSSNREFPALKRLEQIFSAGSAVFESEHLLKNGERRLVEVTARIIDYRGRPACLSSIRDITERKLVEEDLHQARLEQQQAAEALKESERTLRVLFEVTQAGIIQLDDQGVVRFANPRMAEMLGLAPEQLLGSDYRALIGADQVEPATENLRQLFSGATECLSTERHYRRADGSPFWGYLTARRVVSGGGGVVTMVGTVTDLSELKSAEEKRLRMEQQMLHVQKLESLGVLAGGIAHDFNNILLAIMGNASLALHRLPPDSPAQYHLEQIEHASDKAADLARQMLAYSGKGHFVLQAVDLNRLVQDMTAMLEVSLSKKVTLHFELDEGIPCLVADATQLRQIVMNLAINATEAIGEQSGDITIRTGCLECDRSLLASTWLNDDLPPGFYDFLEVRDTGCGMDADTLARIFEPFFTTKFTGRGLGMAAILGIVRGHKGAISVESEPGRGTCFRIYLPASRQTSCETSKVETSQAWRGSGTVLLVDDEKAVREVGRELLRALGFAVICAEDGAEALKRYQERRDEISLVLMDLTMPNLNGEETFRELIRLDPGVRVVLSSGFTEQEVAGKFPGRRLAGFMQKPYTLGALRELLSRLDLTAPKI
ncbi:hypothetical protein GMST_25070 [Geomonas silvestris]|uniref:histidine kinase n=1 Tax=Geomonas silvestris TaxID=2740184 RepID=A0A6V8MJP7_9BACT|nr:PAS domain S-box protein [Geomonas silvestris]GFO60182.1 hypothetical protein GMST_25070 [Geomonas silvestris]